MLMVDKFGKTDATLSPTNLPKTGTTILIVVIAIILISGIVLFIKYEILNRYVK